jgi:hypothetical protein
MKKETKQTVAIIGVGAAALLGATVLAKKSGDGSEYWGGSGGGGSGSSGGGGFFDFLGDIQQAQQDFFNAMNQPDNFDPSQIAPMWAVSDGEPSYIPQFIPHPEPQKTGSGNFWNTLFTTGKKAASYTPLGIAAGLGAGAGSYVGGKIADNLNRNKNNATGGGYITVGESGGGGSSKNNSSAIAVAKAAVSGSYGSAKIIESDKTKQNTITQALTNIFKPIGTGKGGGGIGGGGGGGVGGAR